MKLRNHTLTSSPIWLATLLIFITLGRGASASFRSTNHEPPQAVPCVFDNFVWFKDQEIIDEIRKDWPSFDGTAPESGDAIRKILGGLERLLKSRRLPAQVDYKFSSGDEFQYRPEHVFRANEAKLLVCQVFFPNGATPFDQELQQAVRPLINKDYSRVKARAVVETMVVPVFRKHGYLRARARPPLGEVDPSCPRGVTIRAPIEPGVAYVWDKVIWSGNKIIPAQSLDQMLAMRAGEVANGQKIDLGLAAVIRAYGKQGYVTLQLEPKPEFDDLNKRVALNLAVNEGPQFRMGNLSVLGLSESGSKMFKDIWRIKTGDLYDVTYLGEFLKRLVDAGGVPADQLSRIKTEVKPDRRKLTVDVTIDFAPKS
jgi:hypothetical protein